MEQDKFLQYATPESEGIASAHILKFVEQLEKKGVVMHSYIILRHGKIVSEGYYAPFDEKRFHRMYSISKSFVSVAIGLLQQEGKIDINHPMSEYVPELVGETDELFKKTTIRDMLMMSTPHDANAYEFTDQDWPKVFYHKFPASHEPGGIFSYNTGATVLMCYLVEKLAGMPILDYLRGKFLDKVGFSKDAWCVKTPSGGSWAGSGILCTPRDLAKFALVVQNSGKWNGEQLLPADYIADATAEQIASRPCDMNYETGFGYGYQFWRVRHNGFACVGMGGQFAVMLPDKDLTLITTADTQGYVAGADYILDTFWDEIYDKLRDVELPVDDEIAEKLAKKLDTLTLPFPRGEISSPLAEKYSGKTYQLKPNQMGMEKIQFVFENGKTVMNYTNKTGEHSIVLGMGKWEKGKFPEKHYYYEQIGTPSGREYESMSTATWTRPDALFVEIYITDLYCGNMHMNVAFKNNTISLFSFKAAEWFFDEYQGFAIGEEM